MAMLPKAEKERPRLLTISTEEEGGKTFHVRGQRGPPLQVWADAGARRRTETLSRYARCGSPPGGCLLTLAAAT